MSEYLDNPDTPSGYRLATCTYKGFIFISFYFLSAARVDYFVHCEGLLLLMRVQKCANSAIFSVTCVFTYCPYTMRGCWLS